MYVQQIVVPQLKSVQMRKMFQKAQRRKMLQCGWIWLVMVGTRSTYSDARVWPYFGSGSRASKSCFLEQHQNLALYLRTLRHMEIYSRRTKIWVWPGQYYALPYKTCNFYAFMLRFNPSWLKDEYNAETKVNHRSDITDKLSWMEKKGPGRKSITCWLWNRCGNLLW